MGEDVKQLGQDSIDRGFQGHVGGGAGIHSSSGGLGMLSWCTLATVRALPGDDETLPLPHPSFKTSERSSFPRK